MSLPRIHHHTFHLRIAKAVCLWDGNPSLYNTSKIIKASWNCDDGGYPLLHPHLTPRLLQSFHQAATSSKALMPHQYMRNWSVHHLATSSVLPPVVMPLLLVAMPLLLVAFGSQLMALAVRTFASESRPFERCYEPRKRHISLQVHHHIRMRKCSRPIK